MRAHHGKKKLRLPGITKWGMLYEDYEDWCAMHEPPLPVAKADLFTKVRKKSQPDIIRAKRTSLPVCKVCTKIATRLAARCDPPELQDALRELLARHKALEHSERSWFLAFSVVACAEDSQVLFIAIDGSAGSTLPQLFANAPQNALEWGLVGISIFGGGNYQRKALYVYFKDVLSGVGCDRVLSVLIQELRYHLQTRPHRPRYLVLHFDNTVHCFSFIARLTLR